MKYNDYITLVAEADTLDGKKRLGKNQKARRATIAEELSHMTQPPPTPRRAPTGERADFQGNVYAMHSGSQPTLREIRRANRFGRNGGIKAMRSRIQRLTRKRRTGGAR